MLLLTSSGIFFAREAMPHGNNVIVEVNGKPAYTYPLDTDTAVPVQGPAGLTTIEVKDQRVRVREAPCANRICQKEGWVSRGTIVCVPNRIVIIVGGTADSEQHVDAITG